MHETDALAATVAVSWFPAATGSQSTAPEVPSSSLSVTATGTAKALGFETSIVPVTLKLLSTTSLVAVTVHVELNGWPALPLWLVGDALFASFHVIVRSYVPTAVFSTFSASGGRTGSSSQQNDTWLICWDVGTARPLCAVVPPLGRKS